MIGTYINIPPQFISVTLDRFYHDLIYLLYYLNKEIKENLEATIDFEDVKEYKLGSLEYLSSPYDILELRITRSTEGKYIVFVTGLTEYHGSYFNEDFTLILSEHKFIFFFLGVILGSKEYEGTYGLLARYIKIIRQNMHL